MEFMRNLIRMAGGVVMIFAAVFGVTDFRLPPDLELAITYIAYIILALLGGRMARRGYRGIRGR